MKTKQLQNKLTFFYALTALSGLLSAWAFCHINEWLALVALVPFLTATHSASKLTRLGWVYGLVLFAIGFFWMLTSWHRFTGLSSVLGVLPYLFATVLMASSFAGLFFVFEKMRLPAERKYADLLNPLLLASLWTLMEFGRLHLFVTFPLLAPHTGYSLAGNLYALQPVSLFGFSILTFVVVYVNAGLAQSLVTRNVRQVVLPILVLLSYWGLGYSMYRNFENQHASAPEIKAALLSPNFDAEFKWDAANGNVLINTMLGQYQSAVGTSPDLVIWPETTVPWSYAPDDPFLLELKRLTDGKETRNLIGMTTTADQAQFYNSVYLLEPDVRVAGRYDKRLPLALLESRFFGYQLPFRTLGDMTGKAGDAKPQTLSMPKGKAGVMICNESLIPAAAASMANAGADFLANLSNDAWFADSYIPLQHFYNARVRAVETRRDVAVNSNQGFSGHITASGNIRVMSRAYTPQLLTATLRGCSTQTTASLYPFWWASVLVIFSLVILIFKFQ